MAHRAAALLQPGGAHPFGLIGEDPRDIPNNLLPFLAQIAAGRLDKFSVFGSDYPTADGTCERDYLHVDDLAEGHLAALDVLAGRAPGCRAWNLGTGRATSVLQVLHAFEETVGRDLRTSSSDEELGISPPFGATRHAPRPSSPT